MQAWIGVDLDGTLAKFDDDHIVKTIGEPIEAMVERVVRHLKAGHTVKIVTARVAPPIDHKEKLAVVALITDWWQKTLYDYMCRLTEKTGEKTDVRLLLPLSITHYKDLGMIALYDDRAIQVEHNTGKLLGPEPEALQ